MARRFTDTAKWQDEWWGSLSNDHRLVWLYLVDSCSIAGIWKKDFRGLNFNCNTNLTEPDFVKVFGSRVIDRGHYFFIPKFVFFQCPSGLKSNKPAIVSIVKELEKYNLIETVQKLFGNNYIIIKDKGKGKDKGKEEGKGKDEGKYITVDDEKVYDPIPVLEFNASALNGRQSEHGLRSWRDVAPEWFNQNIKIPFKDKNHVFFSFSKYFIKHGRPPNNGRFVNGSSKLTPEELEKL